LPVLVLQACSCVLLFGMLIKKFFKTFFKVLHRQLNF
jgi:hypothetical protein